MEPQEIHARNVGHGIREDTSGPENFAEAVGVVALGERYDEVTTLVLLEFASELVERFPAIVLRHIAIKMNVTVTVLEQK